MNEPLRESSQSSVLVVGVGASRGLGAAIARRFWRAGHPVVIAGRNAEKLEKTAMELNDAGAKATAARIIEDFGWDAADMGTAKAARAIEPLCQLWCIRGFLANEWGSHAFALLRR